MLTRKATALREAIEEQQKQIAPFKKLLKQEH